MDIIYLMKREMLRRNYSHRTIKSYLYCLKNFLKKCHKEPRRFTKGDVRDYLDRLCGRGMSASTLNLNLQALKFAFEEILNKRFFVKLPYSKVPKRLPLVLSKKEVKALIDAIINPSHRLMIELMYSAGLRVSELVKLRVKDIVLSNNIGWVREGKGRKDRLFVIAKRIKEKLKSHTAGCRPDGWLFHGREGHVSQRTIQVIVKKAAKKAGIRKNVHCHTLRHSFATHLIGDGCDVMAVQHVLGHDNLQTTMVYVHILSPNMLGVRSPYDSF